MNDINTDNVDFHKRKNSIIEKYDFLEKAKCNPKIMKVIDQYADCFMEEHECVNTIIGQLIGDLKKAEDMIVSTKVKENQS